MAPKPQGSPAVSPELESIINDDGEPGGEALTSDEEARRLIEQLAEQDDEGTESGTEEPAKGEGGHSEPEGEIDLDSVPEEYRGIAESFFKEEAKDSDLEALLGGRYALPPAERAQAEAAKKEAPKGQPTKYSVIVPEEFNDLKPLLQDIVDTDAQERAQLRSEVESLRQQLADRDKTTGEQRFISTMESLIGKYGEKTFRRILPRAMQHCQEVPQLAATEKGLKKAFATAANEFLLVRTLAKGKNAQRGGTVRQTRSVSTSSSAEPRGQISANISTRDAVRAAARQMKQMGLGLPDGF